MANNVLTFALGLGCTDAAAGNRALDVGFVAAKAHDLYLITPSEPNPKTPFGVVPSDVTAMLATPSGRLLILSATASPEPFVFSIGPDVNRVEAVHDLVIKTCIQRDDSDDEEVCSLLAAYDAWRRDDVYLRKGNGAPWCGRPVDAASRYGLAPGTEISLALEDEAALIDRASEPCWPTRPTGVGNPEARLEMPLAEIELRTTESVLAIRSDYDVAVRLPTMPRWAHVPRKGELPDERAALVAFYQATGGDNWITRTGWNSSEPYCTWYRVTCENGRVVSLRMSQNGLRGTLPLELGLLRSLRELALGGGPGEARLGGQLPDSIGALSSLEILSLSDHRFSGSIPATFAGLNRLRVLSIAHDFRDASGPCGRASNPIDGAFPAFLFNLPNLETLILGRLNLSGPLPELPPGSKLSKLSLYDLPLSHLGTLPLLTDPRLAELAIRDPTNLGCVGLPGTAVAVPETAWTVSTRQIMELGGDRFVGTLPRSIAPAAVLRWLSLEPSGIRGELPRDLGANGRLSQLVISNPNLSGPLPRSVFTSGPLGLGALAITNTRLSGPLPAEAISREEMNFIELDGNLFSNQLPSTTAPGSRLILATFGENTFDGSIPDGFFRLPNLLQLYAGNASLSGAVSDVVVGAPRLCGTPGTAAICRSVKGLDLSNNSLSASTTAATFIDSVSFVPLPFSQTQVSPPQQVVAQVSADTIGVQWSPPPTYAGNLSYEVLAGPSSNDTSTCIASTSATSVSIPASAFSAGDQVFFSVRSVAQPAFSGYVPPELAARSAAKLPRSVRSLAFGPLTVPTANQSTFVVDGSISGTYFSPQQAGHGVNIQVTSSGCRLTMLLFWFVYRNGEPVWIIAQGPIAGNQASLTGLFGRGASFPPDFRPADVRLDDWGDIQVTFTDVNQMTLAWLPRAPGFDAGTLPMERLSTPTQADYLDGAPPADGLDQSVQLSGCHSGAWFDTLNAGHGFLFEVLKGPTGPARLLAFWYVHDRGAPFWLIGDAPVSSREVTIPMTSGRGATFAGPSFRPSDVILEPWGSISVQFYDDNTGRVRWASSRPGFPTAGMVPIFRLTDLAGAECR